MSARDDGPTMTRDERAVRFDFFARYHGEHPKAGQRVQRQVTCHCGQVFTQQQLSAAYQELVDAAGERARRAMQAQIPDGFVPRHCPACERRTLAFYPVAGAEPAPDRRSRAAGERTAEPEPQLPLTRHLEVVR